MKWFKLLFYNERAGYRFGLFLWRVPTGQAVRLMLRARSAHRVKTSRFGSRAPNMRSFHPSRGCQLLSTCIKN